MNLSGNRVMWVSVLSFGIIAAYTAFGFSASLDIGDGRRGSIVRWLNTGIEDYLIPSFGRPGSAILIMLTGIVCALLIIWRENGRSFSWVTNTKNALQVEPILVAAPSGVSNSRLERLKERTAVNQAATASIGGQPSWPETLDVTDARDVAWIKAHGDPQLWHEAAVAAVAYVGDPHKFLPWLVEQRDMDIATAAWLFLWPEGSYYLRGEGAEIFSMLDNLSAEEAVSLMDKLCQRSETQGFSSDVVGLDDGFSEERKNCLDLIAQGKVANGILAPLNIIGKPFSAPKPPGAYAMDDGLLVRR